MRRFTLDHDRQGVAGGPDLAATIFRKIDAAAVFVADVTLVGSTDPATPQGAAQQRKRLINSNAAIEYGYAQHGLGDEAILMVQNTHYGDREGLPFDLKHKAGPIQYRLAPDAIRKEIEAEHAKLHATLIEALKPYLSPGATPAANVPFEEVPRTTSSAFFWLPGEVTFPRRSGHRIMRILPLPVRGDIADGGVDRTELVHYGEYPDRDAARRDLFAYIEGYYNRRRIDSGIGCSAGLVFDPTCPKSIWRSSRKLVIFAGFVIR